MSSARFLKGVLKGADYAGLVFYPRSPRFVRVEEAAAIAQALPDGVAKVGLFVDSGDDVISHVLDHVALDWIQLHGEETPQRLTSLRARFSLPIIKALRLGTAEHLKEAYDYFDSADMLLFDARTSSALPGGALPGGTGKTFDWKILEGFTCPVPWMLSGGLNADNLSQAVRTSGAQAVDVSSGVEDSPGHKNKERIRTFLDTAASL